MAVTANTWHDLFYFFAWAGAEMGDSHALLRLPDRASSTPETGVVRTQVKSLFMYCFCGGYTLHCMARLAVRR